MSGVTASASPDVATIASRNAKARSQPDYKAIIRNARELAETAPCCYGCGADLADAVWRRRLPVPVAPFTLSYRTLPHCHDCATRGGRGYLEPQPCEGGCGRLVHNQTNGPGMWRHRTYCCERCQVAMYSMARRDQRADARGPERTCKSETCRERFTPIRADAKYCSNACRQMAYRARSAS